MDISCPACRSSGHAVQTWTVPDCEFGLGPEVVYAACPACGSLVQSPQPTPAQLASWYPEQYFGQGRTQAWRRVLRQWAMRGRIRKIRSALGGTRAPLCVLDYGCGDAEFLAAWKKLDPGIDAMGYDPVAYPVGHTAPVPVVRSLDELPEASFDLITMHHVIEHISDVPTTLARLVRLLKPGGNIFGETPNANSEERNWFGSYWGGFHAPRHTIIFSAKGLGAALGSAGLGQRKIWTADNPAQAAISLASRCGMREPRFTATWFLPLTVPFLVADRLIGQGSVLRFRATKD